MYFSLQEIRTQLRTSIAQICANHHLCKYLFRLTWEHASPLNIFLKHIALDRHFYVKTNSVISPDYIYCQIYYFNRSYNFHILLLTTSIKYHQSHCKFFAVFHSSLSFLFHLLQLYQIIFSIILRYKSIKVIMIIYYYYYYYYY